MKSLRTLLFAVVALAIALPAYAASTADVLFLVDESGSMSGEHAWLGSMIGSLDSKLVTEGVTSNRYGLVGFGNITHDPSAAPPAQAPHEHTVGTGQWGTAADFAAATSGLDLYGGTEDGWAAINFALNNYSFRSDAALNIILVTDEDRDNTMPLTYTGIKNQLTAAGALLNVVVNANFSGGALGVDRDSTGYYADGSGGYTTAPGAVTTYAAGATKSQYIDLAWDVTQTGTSGTTLGGAAWSLNQLRVGGLTATSFTQAFVDLKAEEIKEQKPPVIPEPGTILLLGTGLVGLAGYGRRRREG